MKIPHILHNTLINRELLPPPFDFCHVSNNIFLRPAKTTLLHQAIASCGRAFCFLLFLLLPLAFVSCEKPEWTEDEVTRGNLEQNDSTAGGTITVIITVPEWEGTREYKY